MKKRKVVSIIAFILLFFVIFFPRQTYISLWFGVAYIEKFYNDTKYSTIEVMSRNDNTKAAHEWVKKAFGATVSEVVELKYDGRGTGWSDCSTFMIETPFASGALWVSSKDQSISGGLSIKDDPKFLHLYSNWVKKQVGIEDENVELVIGFNEDSIDFKEIIKLSDDYREIFESIKESGFKTIYVKNILDLNNNNYKNYFYDIKDKYSLNGKIDNKYFYMELMNYDCDFFNIKESPIKPLNNSSKNLHISIFYWDDKIENIRVNYYN